MPIGHIEGDDGERHPVTVADYDALAEQLAGAVADYNAVREQLRGAVSERDALADAGRKVVLAFLAGTLTRHDIEPLVLALPDTGGQ